MRDTMVQNMVSTARDTFVQQYNSVERFKAQTRVDKKASICGDTLSSIGDPMSQTA